MALSDPADARGGECSVTVEFGSFASGIDRDAERAVLDYVAAQPGVEAAPLGRRGREGEYTLCIKIEPTTRIAQVHRDLTALVPADSRLAPTKVKLGSPE